MVSSINKQSVPIRDFVNQRFEKAQDVVYPLNEYTAHLINNKDLIKSFVPSNPSTLLTIQSYRSLIDNLTSENLIKAKQSLATLLSSSDELHYVLFGSKNFLRDLFDDLLPSSFDILFSYLSSNHIKQVGSGLGTCFIINPSFFAADFSDFYYPQEFDPLDSLSKVTAQIKSLQTDNSYLYGLIEEKDEYIKSLLAQIKELEYKNYMNSQMSWR